MNYVSLKPILPAETPAGSVPRILKLLCCFSVKTERQYSTQKRTRKPIRFVAWSETNYRCSELFCLSKYLQDKQFFFKLSKISENFRRMNIFGNLEIASKVQRIFQISNCSMQAATIMRFERTLNNLIFLNKIKEIYVIFRLGGPYGEKLWPRSWKCFSRPRSQFFTIRTSQPANNIFIFLKLDGILSERTWTI